MSPTSNRAVGGVRIYTSSKILVLGAGVEITPARRQKSMICGFVLLFVWFLSDYGPASAVYDVYTAMLHDSDVSF